MHQYKLLFFFVLNLALYHAKAQEFPNLNLSDFEPLGAQTFESDPIALNPTMTPWRISHGSPGMIKVSNNPEVWALEVASGSSSGCSSSSNISEGAFYPGNFLKGHKYTITGIVAGSGGTDNSIDEVLISFAKGVPDQTNAGDINTRSYCFPSFTRKQDIFYETNFSTGTGQFQDFISFDVTVVLNNDYDQIWISAKDDEGGGGGEISTFRVSALSIVCCEPFIDYFSSTEVLIPPQLTETNHVSLPMITHAKYGVSVLPHGGNINVLSTEEVTFKAGSYVEIRSLFSGVDFVVEEGANFLAAIEDCDCSSPSNNICANYEEGINFLYTFIPPTGKWVYLPGALNPDSNLPIHRTWHPSSIRYQMPYNAYKFEMVVWDRADGWQIIYTDEFEDPCNGIPLGRIDWDGSGATHTGLHTVELTLTNCDETTHFAAVEVNLLSLNNNVTNEEDAENMLVIPNSGLSSDSFHKTERDHSSFSKSSDIDRADKMLLSVSPNPVAEDTRISFNVRETSNVSLYLYSSSGALIQTLINKQAYEAGEHSIDYDTSQLPPGTYYCHLEIDGSVISKKILKVQR